jgi:hypothetical protein
VNVRSVHPACVVCEAPDVVAFMSADYFRPRDFRAGVGGVILREAFVCAEHSDWTFREEYEVEGVTFRLTASTRVTIDDSDSSGS